MRTILNHVALYKKNTPTSAKLFSKSAKFHVNGVSHNIRYYKPYPFVVKSSVGKSLIDVDSNKYTDYWMGHWALILGHGPKAVKDSLRRQIGKGWMYGTVNEQTIALSEIIIGAIPIAEKIRYVTSGTEAAMYAVRLARSVTGRKIIVKVDGGWHGYTSDLLKTVNWPFSEPESSGLIGEEKIVSIPYNNIEGSLAILKRYAGQLAGVIIEPLLGGGGGIPARKNYLAAIQEFCRNNDSLFILDEVVTGFRFRFGCAYQEMKLDPDIVIMGKIVGGGMPIGVICGKEETMRYADTFNKKKQERSYIGGGTFSANPASMVAGLATLRSLKSGTVHSRINSLGEFARKELSKALDGRAVITGKGSLFMAHFTKTNTKISDVTQVANFDTALLAKHHFRMIASEGIFFLPGKMGAISNAHTKRDIKEMVLAFGKTE